jgi:chaperonin GroEL
MIVPSWRPCRLRVGGVTEIEVKEKKDRIDDALNATRAAVEEGIVPSGGTGLLRASIVLDIKGANDDQTAGINIVRKAMPNLTETAAFSRLTSVVAARCASSF